VPAGRIESVQREFTVLSETDLKTPQQFDDLVLKDAKGYLVRLSDVGHAELGALDERRIGRFNGKPAIALGVVKQATANPLEVSNEVAEAMPGILASLPEGMIAKVAHDKSIFIRESVKNVYETIGEAIALVVLIIFLFLRAFRATLVPLVTIPVSLIGAFAIMYMLRFTINTLTLLALVLAIGLVVDDAIVMLENIYRHVEDGEEPVEAALIGSKEIGFAVLAMTLTLAAVYAPIGFMAGTTGKFFTEFAWTLAGAVIVSGFVALTLSPMMCSKLFYRGENHGWLYRVIEAGLRGLTTRYRALLRGALKVRTLVLLIGLAVAGSSYFPSSPPPLGQGGRDKPIQLVIETTRPYDELQVMVDKVLDKAADNPGLVNVDTDLKLNAPQLEVDIDRDKAATVGVEVETLGRTLETLLGGRQVTRFKREGEQYDVIVKVADIDRRNPEDLRRIYVRGRGDTMIPLSNLMSVKESVAPKELNHFNQLRSAMITSHLPPRSGCGRS
jgi:multidrug efflux pump subunit AcrB